MSITVMDTIDQITYAFLTGAAASGMITYYILTHEKRTIASVRRTISSSADLHELTESEWRKLGSDAIASDERIMAINHWAKETCRRLKQESGIKISDISLTAEVIICEEFYGLDRIDALRLSIKLRGQSGTLDDLRALTGTLFGKKSKGTIAEENRRAYDETYQREGRTLKNHILDDLKAISRGQRRNFTPEGLNAANALRERQGDHPDTLAAWVPLLNSLGGEILDAKAIHAQLDELLYPDTLEDEGALKKIVDSALKMGGRFGPEASDASKALGEIRRLRERKVRTQCGDQIKG